MEDQNLRLTGDGSHSVYSEKFQALYHSKHGAIQESQHVFIDSGLKKCLNLENLKILEMGFGTGLNLLLTYLYCTNFKTSCYYEAIEAYPLSNDIVTQLNYPSLLKNQNATSLLESIHSSDWDSVQQLSEYFSYKKHLGKIEEFVSHHKFNLVYYDAFAPNTQAELWEKEIFQHLGNFLEKDAILVSYCSKGSFKRALQASHFEIEKIPGPPGKREMIRATFKS